MASYFAVEQDDGRFALVLGTQVIGATRTHTWEGVIAAAAAVFKDGDTLIGDMADGSHPRMTRMVQRKRTRSRGNPDQPRRRGWRQ